MKKRQGPKGRVPARPGGRFAPTRSQGPASADRAGGEPGMSRRPLTLLEHEGTIWSVYISSNRTAPPRESSQLEFERAVPDKAPVRYTRTLAEPLLRALQAGEPVSRNALREELVEALADGATAGTAGAEGRKRVWRPLNDPDEEVPETTRS
jgi:hypothetical protein